MRRGRSAGHARRSLPVLATMLAVSLCLPHSLDAQSASSTPLTLEQAIDRALAANPEILAGRLARAVSLAGVDVAREWLNPEINYEAERETPRQSIGVVLPIELGGKRARRTELAEAAVGTGEAELAQLIVDVRSAVRRTYFGTAAAERRLQLADDLRQLATRVRDAARARFDAGDVPEIEVVQSELALADADNDVSAARGEVAASRAILNALLGQLPETALDLMDDITAGSLVPAGVAVAQALEGSADLAVLDHQIIEQQLRRALARSIRIPDLSIGPSVTYHAQPEFSVGWRLSFALTLPLFTTHQAGVQLEDAELARLRAERDALAARIRAEVVAAAARASAAREQLTRFQEVSLPRVVTLERMAQDGYTAGQTSLAVLLQALQQAQEIRQRGLQSALDFQSALADLERAIAAPGR